MPLKIIRNDITKMCVDAIVNPTNAHMYGTAGVDGKIHKLAGKQLKEDTHKLGICGVGESKLTSAYHLPSKYIIHTVGPVWHGGNHQEEEQLSNCYKSALKLAVDHEFESIAFPLISTGTFGYPKDQALSIAFSTIGEFLLKHEMDIYIVVYDMESYQLSEKLFNSVDSYIQDHYIEDDPFVKKMTSSVSRSYNNRKKIQSGLEYISESVDSMDIRLNRSLDDIMNNIDHTFSEMLLRLIDERGLLDTDVYKKANVTAKLFSKIRSNKEYTTSKKTVQAFSIALELNLDETTDLLRTAGFAFSNSNKFDLIVKYYIEREDYNIYEINQTLYAFTGKYL